MWVPGSSRARHPAAGRRGRAGGFTLLELLVVVAIIAVASAGVMVSMQPAEQSRLAREGDRLVALLEAARAQSRANGLPVVWHADVAGFRFEGLLRPLSTGMQASDGPVPAGGVHVPWLGPGILVAPDAVLVLGPEPLIARQSVRLVLGRDSLRVGTDGLRPFEVLRTEADAGAS